MTTKFECVACSGTGLYKGFAEPPGTAVICHTCSGKGYSDSGKVPFSGRKPKIGIQRVMCDGGLWMFRTGNLPTISIEEFYEKVKE